MPLEKAFEKVQYALTIKDPKKLYLDGINLNLIKAKYDKPVANIILNGGNGEHSHNSWNEIQCYSFHPYPT